MEKVGKISDARDFVANYELNQYRYSGFWVGREYEHRSEISLLKRLFALHVPDAAKRTIIDLGGAYGRLLPVYGNLFKRVLLADYSMNELHEGQVGISQSPFALKVNYVALNAYRLPFPSASIDALLSVRVMHHLKDMPLFISELFRTLKPGGIAIIEFANKNHILALIRNFLRGNLKYISEPILQVQHDQESAQGTREGQIPIMYNFSPSYIKKLSQSVGFSVDGMYACSFLRSALLKKLFPTSLLVWKESILQRFFGWLHISPSVFIVLRKKGVFEAGTGRTSFVCPTCNSPLQVREKGTFACTQGHLFKQKESSIVDLRDPRPETIDF